MPVRRLVGVPPWRIGPSGLQARLDSIARQLQGVLEQGVLRDSKAATFRNLLGYSCVVVVRSDDGVEPTNNHVERILPLGVLWRKNAFGCHSEAGVDSWSKCSSCQILRLQKRPVLDYLYRAIVTTGPVCRPRN